MGKISKCRECGAPIRWERTKNNNPIPCNPKAIYYTPDRDGNLYVLTNSGEVVKAREGTEPGAITRVGFIPHFATCKVKKRKTAKPRQIDYSAKAEEYRRKKAEAEAAEEERIAKRCAEIQAAYEESQRIKQLSFFPDDYSGWARR